jgi:hypothetical protein
LTGIRAPISSAPRARLDLQHLFGHQAAVTRRHVANDVVRVLHLAVVVKGWRI